MVEVVFAVPTNSEAVVAVVWYNTITVMLASVVVTVVAAVVVVTGVFVPAVVVKCNISSSKVAAA